METRFCWLAPLRLANLGPYTNSSHNCFASEDCFSTVQTAGLSCRETQRHLALHMSTNFGSHIAWTLSLFLLSVWQTCTQNGNTPRSMEGPRFARPDAREVIWKKRMCPYSTNGPVGLSRNMQWIGSKFEAWLVAHGLVDLNNVDYSAVGAT